MMDPTLEQQHHDEVNLKRLVRRLEKSADSTKWNEGKDNEIWIRVMGVLQTVKYGKLLLKNVELYDENMMDHEAMYTSMREKLENVQSFFTSIKDRVEPKPTKLPSILSRIPKPIPVETNKLNLISVEESLPSADPLTPSETTPLPIPSLRSANDLLLSPSESSPLSPPSAVSTSIFTSTTNARPRFISNQNTDALHQELTDQLAQMAAQLKKNATHFSNTLEKDKDVVDDAQMKIENNFETMQKERTRLKNHSGKSTWTTCFTLLIVMLVTIVFILMVGFIRVT